MTHTKVKRSIAAGLAATVCVASTAILLSNLGGKAYAVNFDEGNYSVWDGVTYTFDWFESPSMSENGTKVYTIDSASDFAALAIITNDLSNSEFDYITSNIGAEDAEYIEMAHQFDSEIIQVTCDIDLADKDWFPISYPWKTANLSSTYEFTNTNGETVKYEALSHVPELEMVDGYVGDPISTRYWEFPESELRFRDLTYFATPVDWLTDKEIDTGVLEYMHTSGLPLFTKDQSQSIVTENQLNISAPNIKVNTTKTHMTDYYADFVRTYGYKDIKGFTESDGFGGTLDFVNEVKLKGLKPVTKWTDDPEQRLHTYDPLGKALIGMLGENGVVKGLLLKGSYDDIASYSAFVAAYNYGTITNTYVLGHMKQQLISQIYPINRDYSPNHDSTYRMSAQAGTVLPVGHCGYMSAVNYGTISNCVTEGEVTQAFRAFGFMACDNYGTIETCDNNADISSTQITTDFYTDEWSWEDGGHQVELNDNTFSYWDGDTFTDSLVDIPGYYSQDTATQQQISLWKFYGVKHTDGSLINVDNYAHYMASMASTHLTGNRHTLGHGGKLSSNGWKIFLVGYCITNAPPSLYYLDDSADPESNVVWIPQLYNTDAGESIAANHLYGVYSITKVGGICADNSGVISNCSNTGHITALGNTSPRTAWTAIDSTKDQADTRPSYSYIRPTNQYAFLCTQTSTANLAAGICVENTGKVDQCESSTEIKHRVLSNAEQVTYNVNDVDFIPWTQNGFYQNDCIVLGTTSKEIYPGGYRWWITEDNYLDHATYSIKEYSYDQTTDTVIETVYTGNFPTFDRNMPYPFVNPLTGHGSDYVQQLTSAITVYNAGDIYHCAANGAADNAISARSYSIGGRELDVNECVVDGNFAVNNITGHSNDTSIQHCKVINTGNAPYAFARTAYGDHVRISLVDLIDTGAAGGFYAVRNADMLAISMNNSSNPGIGVAYEILNSSVTDIVNHQPSTYGIANLCDTVVRDSEILSTTDYAIGASLTDSEISKVRVFNPIVKSVLGDVDGTTITDCEFYNFYDNNLQVTENVGVLENSNLESVTIFTDVSKQVLNVLDSEISKFLLYGDVTVDTTNDYIMYFENTTAEDMLIQTNVDYTYSDPFISGRVTEIPGILKAYSDTNEFTNCVIQTPDGMISYATDSLFLDVPDVSILSDARLVYDKDARASGALAFYMDHGYSTDRTYDYTVAANDTVIVPDDSLPELRVINLPAYTRKIKDVSETPFYQVTIPLTGRGVGELKGSINGYETTAAESQFPKISLYGHVGDTISLTSEVTSGYALNGIVVSDKNESTNLSSAGMPGEPYVCPDYTIEDRSVQLSAVWSGVHPITIEPTMEPGLNVSVSCSGAAYGEAIQVMATTVSESLSIDRLVYYNVLTDEAGRTYTDYNNPVVIDLDVGYFTMPDNPVVVEAIAVNNGCDILKFVLAGATGVIDDDTITVVLENSVDLSSLKPDTLRVSTGATVSPSNDETCNFTAPVEYTVTAPSGNYKVYTVRVIPTADGVVSEFSILGKKAVIDNTAMTISIEIAESIDLSGVEPYIVYGGTGMISSTTAPENGSTYTVTDSLGIDHTYTLVLTRSTEDSFTGIELKNGDANLVLEVDEVNHVIKVNYPYGMDMSSVEITGLDWYGSAASLAVGDVLNLTKSNTFVITDDLGVPTAYSIVGVESLPTACELWQFVMYGVHGVIEGNVVTIKLPTKYDITKMRPDIVGYTGFSISDISEYHDFSKPVQYTVTSYTGAEKVYTVNVIQED